MPASSGPRRDWPPRDPWTKWFRAELQPRAVLQVGRVASHSPYLMLSGKHDPCQPRKTVVKTSKCPEPAPLSHPRQQALGFGIRHANPLK